MEMIYLRKSKMKTDKLYDEKIAKMKERHLNKRKQYYLFAWDSDNPCGGTSDLIGTYATLKDARKSFRIYRTYRESIDVGSVIDRLTGDITNLGEVKIPNYEPDWEDIAKPKKLSEYGIGITGRWSPRHKRLFNPVSQRIWDKIKDITYEEFTNTSHWKFSGIARKRWWNITENIEIIETKGDWE